MIPDHFERYARQQHIEWWDQERLHNAHVLVAGAGALGNEVLKNLALVGVGHLLLIDFDRIEPSNLSRTVLFREDDLGRPKVEVAAEALKKLNPDVTVQTIQGDLFYDVGLGYYRHSDLAIGCLDNLAARSQVGRSCGLAGIPYLDGGMWSLGGEVRWFDADSGPCFDCTLSSEDREHADERRSCTGFRSVDQEESGHISTVASTASIIGGLLAQEAIKWLCHHPILAGKAIVYNGQALSMHRAELARNPACQFSHTPYQQVRELSERTTSLTARQLLSIARRNLEQEGHLQHMTATSSVSSGQEVWLELGRDFLLELRCINCGKHQEIGQPWGRVLASERICPSCGAIRQTEIIHALDENNPHIDWPLSRLGVPPGEVLAVHSLDTLLLYEIGK